MKILVADRVVATSHDFPSVNCTIDAEDMRYISSLLRNNYSNTILATIRETYANAVDANKENGLSPESIEIKSPNFIDQTFSVRDFGTGLSRDQIFNLYSKFGKSTKRGSDLSIGGFGIGRFAPLSYKDSFTVTSYHEGIKSIYSIYISEENDTKIDEVFSEPTSKRNGICVSVGVSSGDINKFNQEISSFFSNFEVQPHFLNLQVAIAKPEITASGKDWQIRKSPNNYNNWSVGEQGIVMGGIYYPINPELVDFKIGEDWAWTKFLNKLVFIVDIGSVSLHHSRESLEYNKTTKAYLKSRYQSFCNEFVASIKEKIAQFNCLREVMAYYKQVKDTFPRSAFDQLEEQNVFVYQGYKVQNHTFNRSHYESNGENKRIPVYAKLYTLGSGNRVSISKCYTLVNSPDVHIVFNDMPDNTKIVPRIYNLLSNKKATEVIVISHDNAITSSTIVNGVDKFKEVNRFDLIKSGYCNLSELAPVKLPTTKKSSASVTFPANNFYSIDGMKISSSVNQALLSDNNTVKLFIPVSDRKAVGYYECLNHRGERGYLQNRFFSSFQTKFEMSVFGVSNNIATSKKFESRTDFIDFRTYFQDKWNNLSDEVKGLMFEYVSCMNSEYYKITSFPKILQDVDIYKEFYTKKSDIIEKLTKLDEVDFADFVFSWWQTLDALKIHISFNNKNLQDVVGVYLKSVEDSIYNDYPMLKLHGKLHGYGNGENDEDFKSYIDLVNSKKSVDISKI